MSGPTSASLAAPSPLPSPRPAPWHGPMGLQDVLRGWREDRRVWSNVVLDAVQPAVEARHAALPEDLDPCVVQALEGRGITQLYTHQAQAYGLGVAGRDFVIATPTASGKSLCYNLPVLQRLAQNPRACALYLFPTKALSRDQEQSLRSLLSEAGLAHGAITYDGDTPGDARRAARQRSGVLLTNPDMLHAGILPHHANWARLFANLQVVVIDELHTYRGVFGSHLANVLRRLDRIARFHGANPTYMFASATIGNPGEHATRMLGRPVEVIADSGAPQASRQVLLYNPPVVNAELGIRQSYIKASVRIAADLVRARVSTLVFGQSRNNVEVMLKYLRDKLCPQDVSPEQIVGYRGGYLPKTRRRIEEGLRSGEIGCVVATNALELGIDIGGLHAVVCAGYPGSIAALWQRWGRAGRRDSASLAVLVTSSAPLDQFFATQPETLMGAPVEHARIDPDNVEILVQHLKCAAFELPVEEGERFGDLPAPAVGDAMGFLSQHGVVHPVDGERRVYHWSTDAYPANHVSLRSLSWDNFVVIDVERDLTIAEMDWRSTHTMLHEQAIYQHDAKQYQVERLDFDNHKAFVREVAPDYYTTAMTHTQVTVLEHDERNNSAAGGVSCALGEVSVVEKVVGYKKIKFHTHENVGYGEVRLPEMQMHTVAAWFTFPRELIEQLPAPRPTVVDALRAFGNAMHTVAVVGLMLDPHDLGVTLGDDDPELGGGAGKAPPGGDFDPTLFLFDRIPGGVGLAPRIYQDSHEILRRAAALMTGCPCQDGCPACIGPSAGEESAFPRKEILHHLVAKLGLLL